MTEEFYETILMDYEGTLYKWMVADAAEDLMPVDMQLTILLGDDYEHT